MEYKIHFYLYYSLLARRALAELLRAIVADQNVALKQ